MKLAAPGMIILRGYDHFADAYIIPGQYTHSGIVESKQMVIHAVAEGVGRIDILDFCKDCDNLALLEPSVDYYDAMRCVGYARDQIGKPYNFKFNDAIGKPVTSFFCHQLTAHSIEAGGIKIAPILKQIGTVSHEVYLASQFIEDSRIRTLYRV